jgi:hypothetical protein
MIIHQIAGYAMITLASWIGLITALGARYGETPVRDRFNAAVALTVVTFCLYVFGVALTRACVNG